MISNFSGRIVKVLDVSSSKCLCASFRESRKPRALSPKCSKNCTEVYRAAMILPMFARYVNVQQIILFGKVNLSNCDTECCSTLLSTCPIQNGSTFSESACAKYCRAATFSIFDVFAIQCDHFLD